MVGRASLVPPKEFTLSSIGISVASVMLAFFVLPFGAYAADLRTLSSVDVGGRHIVDGDVVTADSVPSLSSFWTYTFSWPNQVQNNIAMLAVIRGTVGHLEGGALQYPTNYSVQNEGFPAGNNTIVKQQALTPIGTLGLASGTYTVVVARSDFVDMLHWLETGDPASEPDQYSTLTFTYDATSHPTELPSAINAVTVGGRIVHAGDEVFRKELAPLNGTTDNYWNFNFDWPNFVQNQSALLMVFRGTYGNVDGGAPVLGTNYGYNLQAWAQGNNDIQKQINIPAPKDTAATVSQYTVMVAERDPKFLDQPVDQQALWFSSGGTQGIAPKSYSFLTFDFKADEPYPVIIVPGILGSAEKNGQWVIDPITHVYDNLIDTLDANGYTREQTLFTFPYDWKKSNVDTALLLRDKINAVQGICHCQKVDLIAHSMGGLVSRQYIQSDNYQDNVDHIIFLGTPHLGAPKDYLMYEAGEVDSGLEDFILSLYLKHLAKESGFINAFDYIHLGHIKSIQELLPNYSYTYDSAGLEIYPSGYPRNLFLENLTTNSSLLNSKGVSAINIVGNTGTPETLTSLTVQQSTNLPRWVDGEPIGFYTANKALGLNRGLGDGTVPLSSASLYNPDLILNSAHTRLPTDAEGYISNLLTGKPANILFSAPVPIRYLIFQIFSPADLKVTAPDGSVVGRDGTSGINSIPGAFYTGFDTDTEFIVIPNPQDGEYKVNALGTGAGGQYTIATNYITESGVVEKDVTGSIGPNQSIDSVAALNTGATDTLVVHGTDIDPPIITIASPLQQDYLHSDSVPVIVTVTDVDSGVAAKIQKWDGVATTSTNLDLFYTGLGTHTFSVSATDVAGNTANSSVQVNVITTPESTILDVNKSFTLGLIKKTNIRDTLVQKINNAIKIEKKIVTLTEQLPGKPKVVKRIEKLQSRLDKILGSNIINELDNQLGKGNITQQGYGLIKADIQWLLTQT